MTSPLTVCLAASLFAVSAAAQEPQPPADARAFLRSFAEVLASGHGDAAGAFFEAASEIWDSNGRLAAGTAAIRTLFEQRKVWNEVTPPLMKTGRIREIAPGVVVADATVSWFGSVQMKRSVPSMLVLRRQEDRWRIVSWSVLGSFGGRIPVQ